MDGDRLQGRVFRVFESLDELVTTVEEGRGVPMTSSCIVPRGDQSMKCCPPNANAARPDSWSTSAASRAASAS